MGRLHSIVAFLILGVATTPPLHGEQPDLSSEAIRAAIARSIPLLEKGSAESADQRTCFTCHNQAVPVLALVEARKRRFAVDEENLTRQLRHTSEHLARGRERYLEGVGQGGKVLTAGYALWTLEAGGWEADETTAAVTHFLLEYQKDADHWTHPGKRPPSSGSGFTTTYVALRGLAAFGTEEQQSQRRQRTKIVGQWLLNEKAEETEDQVFRLRSLAYVDAGEETLQKTVAKLLESQQSDGGWAQKAGMSSDAYATGTVLVAIEKSGGLPSDHPAVRRGLAYLLDTQLEDGSWHVATRAEGFQDYYESGFPHGDDQFISITASSWATLALLLSLPE